MAFGDRRGGFGGNRGGSGGGFRRGGFRRFPVEKTKITCAQCGKEDEVPFKPREGSTVLCKECFMKSKGLTPRTQEEKTEKAEDSEEESEDMDEEEESEEEEY